MGNDSLPTRSRLSKVWSIDPQCPCCHMEEETSVHFFGSAGVMPAFDHFTLTSGLDILFILPIRHGTNNGLLLLFGALLIDVACVASCAFVIASDSRSFATPSVARGAPISTHAGAEEASSALEAELRGILRAVSLARRRGWSKLYHRK
ncbi:hypothetical protein L484_000318 [Morus notabilis]|uniref:Uncharacterized protein n=1 Tax=Morus notabilis TaxID=981085 RepID=W9SDJ7_9ROSA|nr:hypothetical protein L484_000318 [Morus notabilis]